MTLWLYSLLFSGIYASRLRDERQDQKSGSYNWNNGKLWHPSMESHNEAVAIIAGRVRQFYERKEPYRIYHGSTNTTRPSQRRRDQLIDTSKLTQVLQVDAQARTVLVEPNVPMDDLVETTLRYGLVPPVVMEFPGITVGGGFAGQAGESSSFRHGLFDRTVTWLEIVLANGDIATASKDTRADLFYSAAASFGTLGITTLLEVQLIEAKPYVELQYLPVASMREAVEAFEDLTQDTTIDYVDAIMFSAKKGIICSGRLTNTSNSRIQRFTRPTDTWFYLHAERLATASVQKPVVETIPLRDYLFRYDRGTFWTGVYAFRYFVTPFNRVTRWALDYFMHTRVMYHALHKSGFANQYVVQDVAVPYHAADEFMQFLDKSFGLYPIWLAPVNQAGNSPDAPRGLLVETPESKSPDEMINFGVWGPGSSNRSKFVEDNRRLERKVQSLNGRKWLYAHAYYTADEFWSIYNRGIYDDIRAKYNAGHLPTIYEKVKVDVEAEEKARKESWFTAIFWSVWPLSGLYGVYKVLRGGDYLLPRERLWKRSRAENQASH